MSTPVDARPDLTLTRVDVLGLPISAGKFDAVVEEAASWITTRSPSFAIFRDVHGVMQAQRKPDVMAAHQRAGVIACDGRPMVWASRWAGVRDAEQVRGHDFMVAFCARAEREGWKSFFYGGQPGVPQALIEKLKIRFPKFEVAGAYSPPFRPLTPEEDADVIASIASSGADIVWVGLSTPKQELWMADHVGRIGAAALFGVGAAFDFIAGDVRQAPRWVRRAGFEWAFRIAMEPRRLAGRYLRNNPAFVAGVVRRPPHRIDVNQTVPRKGQRS